MSLKKLSTNNYSNFSKSFVISLIILSISNFSFVKTENCDTIDIKIKPTCVRDALNKDTQYACCVLSPINQTINLSSFCKSYLKATSYPTTEAIDGIQYNVVCNDIPTASQPNSSYNKPQKRQNEVKSFSQNIACGKESVTYISDCTNSSTETNSCCYYSYSDYKGCFWLGSKFDGESNYNGIKFNCRVKRLFTNFGLIILAMFAIIL